MVYGFGIKKDFFSVVANNAEMEGGWTVVFGDEGFDAFELFTGRMMFVQMNTEAFSV